MIARILHLQQDMVQFLCLSDDTETEAEDVTMSYLFQACDESSSESGSSGSSSEKKKKKKKKGKAWININRRLYFFFDLLDPAV